MEVLLKHCNTAVVVQNWLGIQSDENDAPTTGEAAAVTQEIDGKE